MKHLLNTLYVTTQGAWLAKDGETVAVKVDEEVRVRIPLHTLSGIVCFGRVSVSPFLMGDCAERGMAISFLTERGRFLARVTGPVSGNVLLRRAQYRGADDPDFSAGVARAIVLAKTANSRTVLLRAARDRPEATGADELREASDRLARLTPDLRREDDLDAVRGREGEAARTYFAAFDHLITARKDAFYFRGRSRRPPLDNMNTLLSFLYTLLMHDVAGAIETVGLDPAVGFLHRDRPGRPGLALDLMEELRAFLADRLALSLVNRQQVAPEGFTQTETGGVMMEDATRKAVLVAWQERKQEELQHPFLGEKVAVGLIPQIQAMLFARYLRGELDGYPPFVWR